jgi:hypothetical protein
MLSESVKQELGRAEHTEFHNVMLHRVIELANMSRMHMKSYYGKWDDAQAAYKAYQQLDEEDRKAIKKGKPTKQRIPAVYAKVQTFKAFMLSLYFQRPNFYELEAVGEEDHPYKDLAETLLARELKINMWFNVLGRWATSYAKYGVGILKHSWEEDNVYIQETVETAPMNFFGLRLVKTEKVQKLKKIPRSYGNKITTVSPYNFLPDTRHPLHKFEEGEFCADECDIPMHRLRQLESEGVCAGIEHVEPMNRDRAQWRVSNLANRSSKINYSDPSKTRNLVRLLEMQLKVVPSKFLLADGEPLGVETYPVKYLIWVANDHRIVRFSPANYLHDKFNHDLAVYEEDDDEFLSMSLPDLIMPLQDTADWFFNSRVMNVSQNLDDKLIIDPAGVDMDSIKKRTRIIMLKKNVGRLGIDNFVKQLNNSDVTAGHMNDVGQIGGVINSVTGLTENLSGQYHGGRRSAAESRVVTQSAAARPKTQAQIAWGGCLAPFGQKLLTNLRQGLTPELIVKYAGQQYLEKSEVIQAFTSTVEDLVCSCDLFVYEGTLDSEKTYMAQQLMELFNKIIELGPTGMLQLELSPKLLLQEIYQLLGVKGLSNYHITKDPQALQMIVQQMAQQMAMQMIEQAQQQQQSLPAPTE